MFLLEFLLIWWPASYLSCFSENRKVSHYIITNQNGQYQIGAQTFNDLPEIVDFYRRHFLDTTTLVEAVSLKKKKEKQVSCLIH